MEKQSSITFVLLPKFVKNAPKFFVTAFALFLFWAIVCIIRKFAGKVGRKATKPRLGESKFAYQPNAKSLLCLDDILKVYFKFEFLSHRGFLEAKNLQL